MAGLPRQKISTRYVGTFAGSSSMNKLVLSVKHLQVQLVKSLGGKSGVPAQCGKPHALCVASCVGKKEVTHKPRIQCAMLLVTAMWVSEPVRYRPRRHASIDVSRSCIRCPGACNVEWLAQFGLSGWKISPNLRCASASVIIRDSGVLLPIHLDFPPSDPLSSWSWARNPTHSTIAVVSEGPFPRPCNTVGQIENSQHIASLSQSTDVKTFRGLSSYP
jgi:hypothetical protein